MVHSGLAELFPRVMSYVVNPERPTFFGHEYHLEGTVHVLQSL